MNKEKFFIDVTPKDLGQIDLVDHYLSALDSFELKTNTARIKVTVELDEIVFPSEPDPDTRDR